MESVIRDVTQPELLTSTHAEFGHVVAVQKDAATCRSNLTCHDLGEGALPVSVNSRHPDYFTGA
ncbi:unannotated protein [freshwater metagenome]|uniref:Unannotated protein n=1 Tax=freshwater metagenome TaxID=449393 RepID=A0A6J7DYG2_9ZZZZ